MSLASPLREMILALQFLTRLPTPQVEDFHPDDLSRAAVWFPLAGAILGIGVALAVGLGSLADPWLGAFLGLLVWTWGTGALHLDGLGDLADALGAAHSKPERLHEVLHDPHAGTFAVVTIVMQLAAKLVGLHAVASANAPLGLVWILAAARLGPLYWTSSLPSAAPGSGERFGWHVRPSSIAWWGVPLLVGALVQPAWLFAPLAAVLWRRFLLRKIGGQTGDALGAGIEIVESVTLLAWAFALGR